jgi:hypothetical protein
MDEMGNKIVEWKNHFAIMKANRTSNDSVAFHQLGNLLDSAGKIEAAHFW